MTAGERFKNWIDGLAESWKDRLRGWMVSWVNIGFNTFLESIEPGVKEMMHDTLTRIRDYPHTTPEIKKAINDALAKPDWEKTMSGWIWYHLGIIPAIMQSGTPFANLVGYDVESEVRTSRLDPTSVITAWRRDKPAYEQYFNDLKEQGWSDDRIEALKFVTLFYPAPADLVRWQAREVFEPEMRERYGLDSEYEAIEKEPFYKAGMTDEQIRNYWRAHWEHASYMQIIEMLHRGVLSLDKTMPSPPITKEGWATRDADGTRAMYDWYRLVEIPPFWRDRLTEMAWNVPTRVDVRRFWDMRTISEEELRNVYHRQGYHGTDLDNYVKWTKVYTDFPMMMTRFSNGWITEEDIRGWLRGLEIPEERITQFIQEKTKPEKPARTTAEKDLTKTEIYKGVKKKLIDWGQGIELLMDLGYDKDEADYILAVNVGVLEGSPETFAEFKDITTKYKIATGREAKPMPEELKRAAAEVVKLTKEVEALGRAIEEEEAKLIDTDVLPAEATARRDELRVSLHRTEAELARVKQEYDRLLAEWRHRG